MATTRNTPTLDEVADDPTLARELPSTAIAALLAKCAALQSALAAALLDSRQTPQNSADGEDRLRRSFRHGCRLLRVNPRSRAKDANDDNLHVPAEFHGQRHVLQRAVSPGWHLRSEADHRMHGRQNL